MKKFVSGVLRSITGRKPFACKNCWKSYKNKASLQRHYKYDCGKESAFPCLYCSYRSKYRHNLTTHLYVMHKIRQL